MEQLSTPEVEHLLFPAAAPAEKLASHLPCCRWFRGAALGVFANLHTKPVNSLLGITLTLLGATIPAHAQKTAKLDMFLNDTSITKVGPERTGADVIVDCSRTLLFEATENHEKTRDELTVAQARRLDESTRKCLDPIATLTEMGAVTEELGQSNPVFCTHAVANATHGELAAAMVTLLASRAKETADLAILEVLATQYPACPGNAARDKQ